MSLDTVLMLEGIDFPFRVEIRPESGGGELACAVSCGGEESARRYAAKYAVGTSHEVIPGHDLASEPG